MRGVGPLGLEAMVLVLVALFIIVPFVELAVFVQVADSIGFLSSLALIVVFSVAGAWLVKREGIGIWRRARTQIERGEVPAREMVDGVLVLLAGALLLVPGFVTDVVGLLLLIPPTRALVRVVAMRRFEKRVRAAFDASTATAAGFAGPFGATFVQQRIHTGEATYRGRGAFLDVDEVRGDDAGGPGDRPPELGRF